MIDLLDSFLAGILIVGMIYIMTMAIAMSCHAVAMLWGFIMGESKYELLSQFLLIPGFIIGCTVLGWFAKELTP